MKNYVLAVDLFGMPKGTELEISKPEQSGAYRLLITDSRFCISMYHAFTESDVQSNPDVFELVRWRPVMGESYYYTSSNGEPYKDIWSDASFDNDCYNAGNCYQTPEDERAMAEKVLKTRLGVA